MVLCLGWGNPRLGEELTENSLGGDGCGGIDGQEVGHEPAVWHRRPTVSWAASTGRWQQGEGRYCPPSSRGLMRPHLEHCVQAWQHQRNMELLEQVQRKARKLLRELEHLFYEDNLRKLGLFSLKIRLWEVPHCDLPVLKGSL